jgi:Skp family chaperone for outer membrane proteins
MSLSMNRRPARTVASRLFAALLALSAVAAVAQIPRAQGQPPAGLVASTGLVKVAVLDTEQVLLGSETGKEALAELTMLQEQKERELGALQQEIRDLQARIADREPPPTEDQLADMEARLENQVAALRRSQDDATRELNERRDEVLSRIDAEVIPVIEAIGRESGYTLIFRKFESGLVYVDDAIDITAAVIERLDGTTR